jgi:hypothetical protein
MQKKNASDESENNSGQSGHDGDLRVGDLTPRCLLHDIDGVENYREGASHDLEEVENIDNQKCPKHRTREER